MRLAFLDTCGWEYSALTPLERPTGGSQSALCYLTVELAKLGHEIVVFNGTPDLVRQSGVQFCHQHQFGRRYPYNGYFDVVIGLNGAYGRALRDTYKVKSPLVLWNHHAHFQPPIKGLKDRDEQDAWDAIVFVSASQRDGYAGFGIDPAKTVVMHNGVSPAFENVALPTPWFATGEPPILFYTSTPYRGLDVLLHAFPHIRDAIPKVRLKVFSSMAVYRLSDKEFAPLYDQAKSMVGVDYVGSVGQAELAQKLAGYAALAHPSTFPECHSIAAIEAMAVGAAVMTTDLGGQREATGGWAQMIPPQSDKTELAYAYAHMVSTVLRRFREDPEGAEEDRQARIQYVRDHYLWKDRAKAWSELLSTLAPEKAEQAAR